MLAQELRLGADGGQDLGLLVLVLRARTPTGVTVLGYGPPTVDQARSDAGKDCTLISTGEESGGGCACCVGRTASARATRRSSCA